MRKIFALILLMNCAVAEAQLTYEKLYDSVSPLDECSDFIITHDGNYVMTGSSNISTSSFYDIHLCKLNPWGNILWTHVYAAPVSDYPGSVKETSDHGFIIGILTNSFSTGLQEPGLLKTDSAGNFLWARTYPVSTNISDGIGDVIETSDHGFALIGSGSDSLPDGLIIKTDSAGNLQWKKYYHGSHIDNFFSGAQLGNGDIIAVGRTRSFPGPYYKTILTRVDTGGNVKWSRVYVAASNETGVRIISADDSSIVIGGHTTAHAAGITDFFIMVLDTAGAFQWAKAYGGSGTEFLMNGSRTAANGFLLTGLTNSWLFGGLEDVYAVRADSAGNLIWAKHYGGIGSVERGLSIHYTPDNGSIIGGMSNSFSNTALYLLKTDSAGNTYCHDGITTTVVTPYSTSDSLVTLTIISGGIKTAVPYTTASGFNEIQLCMTGVSENPANKIMVSFYPNPFNTSATIAISSQSLTHNPQLHIYDVTGREVCCIKLDTQVTKFERGNLLSGIYFYKVTDGANQIATGKFAVE